MEVSKQPLISIIVPVYNTADYLDNCIKSIQAQTYTNFELLLIDDGSTDGSSELCDKYAKQNNRIRVFHKENGGQGSARNLGLDEATGEYIAFVDSDDYVEAEMLEKLMENLLHAGADISCGGVFHKPDQSDYVDSAPIQVKDNLESLELFVRNDACFNHMPVSKIFRAKLFEGVRFLRLTGYEDAGTMFKPFMKAKCVVSQNISLYYYEQREGSTMRRAFSAKDFDRVVAYKEMEHGLREKPAYSGAADIVTSSKIGAIYYVAGECLKSEIPEKEKLLEMCKEESKATLESGYRLSRKNRFLLSMLCVFPKLFRIMYELRH